MGWERVHALDVVFEMLRVFYEAYINLLGEQLVKVKLA